MTERSLLRAAVALALLLAARPLAGQTADEPSRDARWHFSLYVGTTSSGPAEDLEAAFTRESYNESTGCGYLGCSGRTYPYSVTGWGQTGLPFTAEVRFRVTGPVQLGLMVGRTPIGETVGYHYPSELDMEYGVTLVAPTADVSFRLPVPLAPRLHFGGGPAWYGAFWTPVRDKATLPTGHQSASGVLGRAGFEVPVDKGLLIGFDFQYRSVGTITVGPVAIPTAVNRHDLPAMPCDFNHWAASIGFSLDL
ncbi:MAG: hypothetical protein P8174_00980 [Gemmatimonadota bacterium]